MKFSPRFSPQDRRPPSSPSPERRPLLVVAGPTASGKSALALDLALRFGGCVLNADSMQVYRDLHLLTARPSAYDLALAPHRLYGVMGGREVCSAQQWAQMAAAEVHAVWAQGGLPIVTGGTGLYLKALTEGLAEMPDIPDAVRDQTRALLAEVGNERFHALLAEKDPNVAARLNVGDSQRLARAYEVIAASGRSILDWQQQAAQPLVQADVMTLVLDPPRPLLNQRINQRFAVMMDCGALGEVRGLLAAHYPAAAPVMKALGVPELTRALNGEILLPEAVDLATQTTRQFAKRQGTWFRRQIIADLVINTQLSESLREEIFSIVRGFLLTRSL